MTKAEVADREVLDLPVTGNFCGLTYHIIGDGPSQYTLRESQLRAQLAVLNEEGYVVEGFAQLEERLRSGTQVPARYVVLSVDDGHESCMRAADLLEQSGCTATFFLTRDRCRQKRGYIRELQIRELCRRGFSVGGHGTTHRKLTFLPQEDCIKELQESKRWLEDVCGCDIRYMAAPGGYINRKIMRLTHECGFVLTATCREWMNSARTMTLPSEVNRVNVRQHFSLRTFRRAIEGDHVFYVWRRVRSAGLMIPKQIFRS